LKAIDAKKNGFELPEESKEPEVVFCAKHP